MIGIMIGVGLFASIFTFGAGLAFTGGAIIAGASGDCF